jgi:hypothetical protein
MVESTDALYKSFWSLPGEMGLFLWSPIQSALQDISAEYEIETVYSYNSR